MIKRALVDAWQQGARESLVFTIVAELGHGFFLLVMLAIVIRQASSQRWTVAAITMGLKKHS